MVDTSKRKARAQERFQREQFQVDMAHANRISRLERQKVLDDSEAFLEGLSHDFSELYMHLDIKEQKEQLRGVPKYHWRILLTTDRGRYYAEDGDFGVLPALHKVFDALEYETQTRLGRLETEGRRFEAEQV